MKENEIKKEEP